MMWGVERELIVDFVVVRGLLLIVRVSFALARVMLGGMQAEGAGCYSLSDQFLILVGS
jgi:hypothetical protein